MSRLLGGAQRTSGWVTASGWRARAERCLQVDRTIRGAGWQDTHLVLIHQSSSVTGMYHSPPPSLGRPLLSLDQTVVDQGSHRLNAAVTPVCYPVGKDQGNTVPGSGVGSVAPPPRIEQEMPFSGEALELLGCSSHLWPKAWLRLWLCAQGGRRVDAYTVY